jgi:hypothetical protein
MLTVLTVVLMVLWPDALNATPDILFRGMVFVNDAMRPPALGFPPNA